MRGTLYLIFLMLVLLCAACQQDEFTSEFATPALGPSSGYYPLVLDLESAGVEAKDVHSVDVGELRAIHLMVIDEHRLEIRVQGNPESGPVDIRLHTESESVLLPQAFSYTKPGSPHFERVVAIGASLTQGVMQGTPSAEGVLFSPAAQLARQLEGYFPLPVLKDPLLPGLKPEDIGEAPECIIPNITTMLVGQMLQVLPNLKNPETGIIDFRMTRVDPDLMGHNLAVGGSMVSDVLNGPDPANLGGNFVAHLVYEPSGTLMDPVSSSQIELTESLEPTLIVSFDLVYNDVVKSALEKEEFHPDAPTPVAEVVANLEELIPRLANTGAEIFIANMPGPSILPAMQDLKKTTRAALITDGLSEAEAQSQVDEISLAIDTHALEISAQLEELAAQHPTVHVVDIISALKKIEDEGLILDGQDISVRKFGGLIGLDGVHFTKTGYALLANEFIDEINAVFGTTVKRINLEDVLSDDFEAPEALRKVGLDPDSCD